MNIYDEIGIRPFINARGMLTRYGGSIMPEPVVDAMAQASRQFVNIFDLQDRVGLAIAEMTLNEAAFVSCGAASGITLAVASCIAGTDEKLADRLPDTRDMKNEIIMSRCQRGTEADPAVRAAGGHVVEIGPPNRMAAPDEFLKAITPRTAAILFIAFETGEMSILRQIVEGARAQNIPVLVDGAFALPPKENLWRYTRELGADAFITSGGKAICGPQSTGLVLGKQTIIDGCKYHSSPNLRLGRGMKVGKEEFAGIYAAIRLFLAKEFNAQNAAIRQKLDYILECVRDIRGLDIAVEQSQLSIEMDPTIVKTTGESIAKMLLESDPSILISGRGNRISVRADQLQPGEEKIVGKRLREVLTGG